MASIARRTLQGLAVLALAGGIALTTSAPAQAGTYECVQYLIDRKYIAGPSVYLACEEAQEWDGPPRCIDRLVAIRVHPSHAEGACYALGGVSEPMAGRYPRPFVRSQGGRPGAAFGGPTTQRAGEWAG